MNFEAVETKRKMQLSELDEWREKAYHNAKIYNERTKRWRNKMIKKKEFAPALLGISTSMTNSFRH